MSTEPKTYGYGVYTGVIYTIMLAMCVFMLWRLFIFPYPNSKPGVVPIHMVTVVGITTEEPDLSGSIKQTATLNVDGSGYNYHMNLKGARLGDRFPLKDSDLEAMK